MAWLFRDERQYNEAQLAIVEGAAVSMAVPVWVAVVSASMMMSMFHVIYVYHDISKFKIYLKFP